MTTYFCKILLLACFFPVCQILFTREQCNARILERIVDDRLRCSEKLLQNSDLANNALS